MTVFPTNNRYILANAAAAPDLVRGANLMSPAPDGLAVCDIYVADGNIERIAAAGPTATGDAERIDLQRGIVLPRFVDVHTHIDKGHILARSPNIDGTFLGARMATLTDRENRWTANDLRARMDFALRCAYAHGTSTLRTHLDSLGKQAAISWPVFAEMREAWRGRIDLQAVALQPVDIAVDDEAQFKALIATISQHGGVMGGLTFMGAPLDEKFDRAIARVFEAASASGLDVDFHVDESDSNRCALS